MADYRLYLLDGRSRHFMDVRAIEAQDDARAIDNAERDRTLGPMELWCSARKVQQWEAIPRQPIRVSP